VRASFPAVSFPIRVARQLQQKQRWAASYSVQPAGPLRGRSTAWTAVWAWHRPYWWRRCAIRAKLLRSAASEVVLDSTRPPELTVRTVLRQPLAALIGRVAGGISPAGSRGSVREPLGSCGSSHPVVRIRSSSPVLEQPRGTFGDPGATSNGPSERV